MYATCNLGAYLLRESRKRKRKTLERVQRRKRDTERASCVAGALHQQRRRHTRAEGRYEPLEINRASSEKGRPYIAKGVKTFGCGMGLRSGTGPSGISRSLHGGPLLCRCLSNGTLCAERATSITSVRAWQGFRWIIELSNFYPLLQRVVLASSCPSMMKRGI